MLLILDLATLLTCHKNTEQAKQKKTEMQCTWKHQALQFRKLSWNARMHFIRFAQPSTTPNTTQPPSAFHSSSSHFLGALPCEFLHAQWLHRRRLLAEIMKVGRTPYQTECRLTQLLKFTQKANPAAARGGWRVDSNLINTRHAKSHECGYIVCI